MPLIDIDLDVFERSFGRAPVGLRHRLADHPLLLRPTCSSGNAGARGRAACGADAGRGCARVSITFHMPPCADEIVPHRLDASLRWLAPSLAQIGRRPHDDRVKIAAGRGLESVARRGRGRR